MRFFGAVLNACALWSVVYGADYTNDPSVQLFQEYLRINTTTNNNLDDAVAFWQTQASNAGVEFTKLEFDAGYPVLVLRWPGSNSSLGSIMLNSHMDVVPADQADGWSYPPFDGTLDSDGVIWGRGTQDMKSVSIQYLEALKRIKANGTTLLRDVYMTLMPDEETGAQHGMTKFLESDTFKAMNIALELDEGSASGKGIPLVAVFYQDKIPWQIQIDCYGEPAHSSLFIKNPAIVQCTNFIEKMKKFREDEYVKYESSGKDLTAGVYTVVNLNILSGGTATNVYAAHVILRYDIRLAINVKEDDFDKQLKTWIKESGDNITLTYLLKGRQSPATLTTSANPFWTTFRSSAASKGLELLPLVTPGATDGRYVRDAGYPAFGFSPQPNTETLLHSVNERLGADTFLNGIDIYQTIITNLANIPGSETNANPSTYLVKKN